MTTSVTARAIGGRLDLEALLRSRIRDVPDFPEPGVLYKDITPLLADHVAFAGVVDALVAHRGRGTVDKIAGIEARGFILGAAVAYHFGAGFVPVRKSGKLPATTFSAPYELEYGSAVVEVHRDAFRPGETVLVIDDVLATGGTAITAVRLVQRAGGVVAGVSVLLELEFLGGRARLAEAFPDLEVHSLLVA